MVSKSKRKKHVINVTASIEDVKGGMVTDSISIEMRRALVKGNFCPADKGRPSFINSNFTIDNVGIGQAWNFVGIRQGSYHIRLDHKEAKKWLPSGDFSFKTLIAVLPQLGMPITMPATSVYAII